MRDTNVGIGMVPCRKGCRCDDCTIDRLQAHVNELQWKYDDACYSHDAREKEIEEFENPWISVENRLPLDTKTVLAWVPNNLCHYMVTLRPNGEWSSWQGDYRYWWCDEITHWMPLPEPPEDEK